VCLFATGFTWLREMVLSDWIAVLFPTTKAWFRQPWGMKPQHTMTLLSFFFLAALSALAQAAKNDNETKLIQKGAVVERVTKGGQADKAGIRVGDILLDWSGDAAFAEIESPFALPRIETEQSPRGMVRIGGLRANTKHTWLLRSYGWYLATRPNMQGELLRIYEEGHELAKAGKVVDAVERWRSATVLAQKSEDSWLPSWLLLRSAQWLLWAGQEQTAFQFYKEAVQRAAASTSEVRADLLWQWASALESSGDTIGARQRYEDVVLEWQKVGPETIAGAAALVDLGRLALRQGDLAKAEACFNQVLAMRKHLSADSVQIAVSLINLGRISEGRGDLAKAEDHYRRALAAETKRVRHSSRLAEALSNLAALAYQRGNLAGSELYYHKALVEAERSSPGSLEEADVLEALAECVAERGRPSEAERFQRRALAIRQKESPESLVVASSLAGLGRTARIRGDLDEAEEYYQQALAIAEKSIPVPLELSNFLIGAGNVFRARQELGKAESCYMRALIIMDTLAPGSANHTDTLAVLAGILRQQRRFDESSRLYEQALTEIEQKAVHLGGVEDDRFRYEAFHAEPYREYVSLLLETGKAERAFEVLEASRAHSLLEILSRGHIDIRQGVDHSLLARERRLQQLINAKSDYQIRALQEKHTEEQAAAMVTELDRLLGDYQEVQGTIRASSPAYTALTKPRRWTVKEIQGLLDENTILLEYGLGKERSYVWVVSATSIDVYELPKRAEIENVVRAVYRLLNARNSASEEDTELQREARYRKADAEYERTAAQLSQMILAPIAPFLERKRLLVVSDGGLQYIPFAALPAPRERVRDNGKAGAAVPLVVEHEIVNLPSAAVLAELRQREGGRAKALKAVAVLADPVFDGRDERVLPARLGNFPGAKRSDVTAPRRPIQVSFATDRLTRSLAEIEQSKTQRLFLARLPASREEAKAILAVTPAGKGMEALDFEASRATAMNPALAQFRVVHIATHGLLNSKHPELSGLVLSMVDKQGKSQNGFLQLQDVYNLQLAADLVVLSGCETGLGKQISGEGLIGLTRGFMYAGAQRVVASLWSVSDKATAELMARFYRAMEKDGLAPAGALRRAQIEMWRQSMWSSPYYWAAFQLQGEWK